MRVNETLHTGHEFLCKSLINIWWNEYCLGCLFKNQQDSRHERPLRIFFSIAHRRNTRRTGIHGAVRALVRFEQYALINKKTGPAGAEFLFRAANLSCSPVEIHPETRPVRCAGLAANIRYCLRTDRALAKTQTCSKDIPVY